MFANEISMIMYQPACVLAKGKLDSDLNLNEVCTGDHLKLKLDPSVDIISMLLARYGEIGFYIRASTFVASNNTTVVRKLLCSTSLNTHTPATLYVSHHWHMVSVSKF